MTNEMTTPSTDCCSGSANSSCCSTQTSEAASTKREVLRPAVDIVETSDSVVLTADVPGATENTVELEIAKGVLKLSATDAGNAPEWGKASMRTRIYERTFRLSDELDAGSSEATVANGVLTIRIPKKAEAKPAKIAVRAAN